MRVRVSFLRRHRSPTPGGSRSRPRPIGRWTRWTVPALRGAAFVALAWIFGGSAGGAIGLALVLLRAKGAHARLFWILAVASLALAPLAVLAQGLPAHVASPSFGPRHWVAHLLVGVALASLAMAGFIDVTGPGSAGPQEVEAG